MTYRLIITDVGRDDLARKAETQALRRDEQFAYAAAWEYKGDDVPPALNKEPLVFENVALSQRSYK